MSANSEKIPLVVRLPNKLFWDFVHTARQLGESRSAIVRRLVRRFLKRNRLYYKSNT